MAVRGTKLALGVALLFFILVVIQAMHVLNTPPEDLGGFSEPFVSAPTRAADCTCLPGYIPSKESSVGSLKGVDVFKLAYNNEMFVIIILDKKIGKLYYTRQRCNMCGIDLCSQAKPITPEEWYKKYAPLIKSRNDEEELSCSILERLKNENKYSQKSETYFCQNLSDPQKTRRCY